MSLFGIAGTRSGRMVARTTVIVSALMLSLFAQSALAQSPSAGPNVNMVSGTDWTTGDPFLQRQNEPSVAVSTRNPSHLLAGANDYRSVDFEQLFGATNGEQTADAWLGVFKSFDGGATWKSTLFPGFPADSSTAGRSSPLFGLQAAADPIVRAGTNGMFYYAGIAFNRNSNVGKVFVARFIDNNNKENGDPTKLQTPGLLTAVSPTDPIRYLGTNAVQSGTSTQFLDKPWLAVDVPRGTATCTISFTNPDGTTGSQTIPASNVYLTFSDFVNGGTQSMILFTRSTNCGATWSTPIALSPLAVNQGSVIAVAPPIPGTESLLPPVVYVAWRRFGSGRTPGAIMMAESFNGGASFTPAFVSYTFPLACNTNPTGTGCPFDQGITQTSFRTNAYPALAADTTARMYLAWSQRQANGDARIVVQVGVVGIPFPPPVPVDNGFVLDDFGNPFPVLSGRGHQVMPSLTFNAGKLMLIYYDLRQDHTLGRFTALPDLSGYSESRLFEGELPGDSAAVFNPWIDDAGFPPTFPLTTRRHTLDLQGSQASPRSLLDLRVPAFTNFRIAHYQFGFDPASNPYSADQLEVNPPNLPMFQLGHAPFMGDYIDVAGATPFVFKGGRWHFNTDSSNGQPVFHAAWTDNRNVRPPANLDWTQYTPPYSLSNPAGGTVSKFDPTKTTLVCNPNFVASRNQDIYTARIAPGLIVSVPGNQKPLGNVPGTSTLLQRAFSVVVQNTSNAVKTFRLTIANQPLLANGSVDPLGQATFRQLPPTPTVIVADVPVNPLSSASSTVFVKSQNPTATVQVNVQEITQPGGPVVSGGLTGTAIINPDPTTPAIINPDNPSVGNPSVGNSEVYNPSVGNPSVGNPSVGNATLLNPSIGNPSVGNPSVGNPSVGNPSVGNQAIATALNPSVGNPSIGNPSIGNPSIGNPSIGNQSVTDASYDLTNNGNTTATYNVRLFGSSPISSTLKLQLILNKVYYLNQPGGTDPCTLEVQPTNVILSNIPNPPIVIDPSQLGNPSVGNPSVGNATVAVPPGETVQITLRISPGSNLPPLTAAQVQSQVLNNVTPVVVAQAINTTDLGITNPQPPLSLTILTKSLPSAPTNGAYSQQLVAIGGVVNPLTPPYTWSLVGNSVLPSGLNLSSSGVISGTPTTGGLFNFTVQVADAATPAHTVNQALSIFVVAPLVFTPPALQTATVGQAFTEDLSTFTSGGVQPYSYTVTVGSVLPFALNGSTISGTPSATGSASFTVTVTDALASSVPRAQTINIVNPAPQGSCQPSSSLSVLVSGSNVTSYVPKGNWSVSSATGVSVVNIEGSVVTPTPIPTANTVNSCASNSVTGQTVCTANNTDVYLITGTTLGSTLTSGGSGAIGFSGGSCTNCGVAMDAVHNKAVIGLSIDGAPGFQFLNLATSSFEAAFRSPSGKISEDPLLDPIHNQLLSASESNNYEIVDVTTSTSPTFFENAISVAGAVFGLDSSGEDCTTRIALASVEEESPTPSSSRVYIADLNQAAFTAGLPGTWTTTGSQVQTLSEATLRYGASGIAVAQGTHTGVVTGEFGGDAITAIALPATSGSGTPAVSDWVTCSIGNGFSNGFDPHTVTAYKSPNTGHAIAVLANGGATTLAVVDLTMMLDTASVPRTVGGHGCSSGTLPSGVESGVVSFVTVP
jgi:hypothetical protein